MISQAEEIIARKKFEQAAKDFDFVFHSPFALSDTISAFGYIENYGSKNGVVICLTSPPDFPTNRDIIDWCDQMGCFISFVSIEPLLGEYKTAYFRELLLDWGKF